MNNSESLCHFVNIKLSAIGLHQHLLFTKKWSHSNNIQWNNGIVASQWLP